MIYFHPTRPDGAVKSVLPHHAAADLHDPPERTRGDWVVRVPIAFADARSNGGLGHRFGWTLLVLEGYCRARCYCWVGNAELARAVGCDVDSLKRLLRQMEAAGLILRVRTAKGRPGRLGIALLVRADPDLPVADRAGLPAIVALMAGARGANTPPSGGRKGAPSRGAEAPPLRRTSDLKKDEDVNVIRAEGGDPDPDPEAVRPTEAQPLIAAPGEPPEPPVSREVPVVDPAFTDAATGRPGVQAPPPESDPTPTREQIEAELTELEARLARQAPRPAGAMDRIRLANLRALRDGTWKADPLAGGAAPSVPVETPKLGSWPATMGPVETETLIRRLTSPGSGPEAVEQAALRVSERLNDAHSLAFYRKAFTKVRSGEVPVSRVLSAWKLARTGSANCPGAVFNAFLKGDARR